MIDSMYTRHAEDYAQAIRDNVYNGLLERPSMLSMLPELQDKKILDLGCGPGAYCRHFIEQGAIVRATDRSAEMVELVQREFGEKVSAYQHDLAHGLKEESSQSIDLIVCPLTIHYLNDLMPLFSDVRRVLKDDGSFFFSTHHPMVDFSASPSGNYFKKELITEEWDTIGKPVEVQFFRRSLTELFRSVSEAGLYVARLEEGKPAEAMKDRHPDDFAWLSTHPNFIFFECKKLD
ncbi:class I SAM-dependent methyltransferase [Endozoicomonas lisbonensis]|uniref:SAM-dependent methyltransferase n=1 Tax=Endozoicomonas lisbonensis TaxID=3120522 RepID=A0ABV2SN50_9GAMM